MKNVLITGMGLVGTQLVKKLNQNRDSKPIVLDINFFWPYIETIIDRNDFIAVEGSILDEVLITEVLRKYEIDCIVHTAAILPMRVGHAAHPGFFKVNTWGTANLMFLGREAHVSRFVMFSTNGVYQFRPSRRCTEKGSVLIQ